MGRKPKDPKQAGDDFRAFLGVGPEPSARAVSRLTTIGERSFRPQEPDAAPGNGESAGQAETCEPDRGEPTESGAAEANEPRRITGKRRSTQFGALILDEIGNRFADLRENGGRAEAWATFQSRIMRNLGVLVPDMAQLASCVSIALEIESFLKSEIATARSASDLFSDWLRDNDVVKPQ